MFACMKFEQEKVQYFFYSKIKSTGFCMVICLNKKLIFIILYQ
jgi:hypothetical protein